MGNSGDDGDDDDGINRGNVAMEVVGLAGFPMEYTFRGSSSSGLDPLMVCALTGGKTQWGLLGSLSFNLQ